MVQKIFKSPLPSKQNFTRIQESDLDSTFERVVFNDKGVNYLLSFAGDDENIRAIAQEVVDENKPPNPALFTEGSTTQAVSVGTRLLFNFEGYNPDNIVSYSNGIFELNAGYLYKLSAQVSARSTEGVGVGIEYRWHVDGVPDGLQGGTSSFDYDKTFNNDYADLQNPEAVVYVATNNGVTVNAEVVVQYVDDADGKGVTDRTDGLSSVQIEVIKKL